ncbi:MAG: FtsX-like permease family protein [Paludibaculum sp.]
MPTALLEEQLKANPGRDKNCRKRSRASRMKLEPGGLGQSDTRESMKTPLIVLIICTGLVLLIAAANAANLLLARAAQRSRELSIRSALGAGKMQIIGRLTEAMLLSVAGGVVGIILGSWVLDALISSMGDPETNSYSITAHLDPKVLLFAVVVALITGVLFGLYPAYAAARNSVSGVLKEDSNNASASRGGVRVRKALVTAQVAISLLLLIPMGLFLKSLVNLLHENLGLRTENVVRSASRPT